MTPMTVKQLIKILKQVPNPENCIVIVSSDSEGNSYSPVPGDEGFCLGRFLMDSGYSGDFLPGDEDDGLPCIALWPTQ